MQKKDTGLDAKDTDEVAKTFLRADSKDPQIARRLDTSR
jgi:hypothetical protein